MQFLHRPSTKRAHGPTSLDDRARTDNKARKSATARPHESSDEVCASERSTMDRPQPASAERKRLQRTRPPMYMSARTANDSSPLPKSSKGLGQQAKTMEYAAGPDIFPFPTPSHRVPPHSSTTSRRHHASTTLPPASPAYQMQPMQSPAETPHVGVALGSPSAAPLDCARSHNQDTIATRWTAGLPPSQSLPPVSHSERTDTVISAPKQKKLSSWKTFSNLFRGKAVTEPLRRSKPSPPASVEPADLDPPVAQREADFGPPTGSLTPLSCFFAPSPGLPKRRGSLDQAQSRAPSRHEQLLDAGHRTSAVPRAFALRAKGATPVASPTMKPQGVWRASQDAFERPEQCDDLPIYSNEDYDELTQSSPRLDLDLPGVEFPRFSIMFENQLSSSSRPSLLERRQSKLQRSRSQKRTENSKVPEVDFNRREAPRSMISPSFKRPLSIIVREAPAVKVEPATATALQRPPPPMRAVTAPVGTMSPIADAFMPSRQDTRLSSSPESQASAFYSENSIPTTPTTVTTCTDTESARRMLVDAEPFLKPPVVRSFSHPAHMNIDCALTEDDEDTMTFRTDELYPRLKSPEDLERQIVQVSVARQVSVSLARTRVMKAMEGTARPAAVPLRPRIIEFSKNRKSAAGVLDDASADCGEEMPENAAARSRAASLAFEEAKRRSVMSTKSAKSAKEQDVPDVPSLGRGSVMTANEIYESEPLRG
ncbi:hypothetical protein BST61_g2217 [Cercospora zeina]